MKPIPHAYFLVLYLTFFCLYNPAEDTLVFIRNHYQDASEGASRQVAEFLSRHKVREVYAVKVGENARRHLDRLKIEFHQAESGLTIGQVMESIVRSGKD